MDRQMGFFQILKLPVLLECTGHRQTINNIYIYNLSMVPDDSGNRAGNSPVRLLLPMSVVYVHVYVL